MASGYDNSEEGETTHKRKITLIELPRYNGKNFRVWQLECVLALRNIGLGDYILKEVKPVNVRNRQEVEEINDAKSVVFSALLTATKLLHDQLLDHGWDVPAWDTIPDPHAFWVFVGSIFYPVAPAAEEAEEAVGQIVQPTIDSLPANPDLALGQTATSAKVTAILGKDKDNDGAGSLSDASEIENEPAPREEKRKGEPETKRRKVMKKAEQETSEHPLLHSTGPNIISNANEPELSEEDLRKISFALTIDVGYKDLSDTVNFEVDPKGEYVSKKGGIFVIRKTAFLNEIDPQEYMLGISEPMRLGMTKSFSKVVMMSRIPNCPFVSNFWFCDGIIIEGVKPSILNSGSRGIGYDLARIGLPKMFFGPVMETLRKRYHDVLDHVSETNGFYWMNASWLPVSLFFYRTADGDSAQINKLDELMKYLDGKSSHAEALVAIYLSPAKGNSKKYHLFVAIGDVWHRDAVDYRSPSQTAQPNDDHDDESEEGERSFSMQS